MELKVLKSKLCWSSLCSKNFIPELVLLLENGSSSQEFYAHLSRKRHLVCKKEKLSDDRNYSIVRNLQNCLLIVPQNEQWLNLWWNQFEHVYGFLRFFVGE